MGKWLAAGSVALIVLLIVLWKQLDPASATPAPPPTKPQPVQAAAPTTTLPAPETKAEPVAVAEPEKPTKIDPQSDAFFYKFDEVVPANLTRAAATCYEGHQSSLHRNQKMRLVFKTRIRNGDVTIHDVKVDESTIKDPALEACFLQAVQRSTWHDDELPDWDQDDQLLIRPERGMKKYMRDNIEYVGAPAPKD